jgi:hypothetical protein
VPSIFLPFSPVNDLLLSDCLHLLLSKAPKNVLVPVSQFLRRIRFDRAMRFLSLEVAMNPLKSAAYLAIGSIGLVAFVICMSHRVLNLSRIRENTSAEKSSRKALQPYGQVPLSFVPAAEQSKGRVEFISRGSGYTLMLGSDEALLGLKSRSSDPIPPSIDRIRYRRQTNHAPFLDMRLSGAMLGTRSPLESILRLRTVAEPIVSPHL